MTARSLKLPIVQINFYKIHLHLFPISIVYHKEDCSIKHNDYMEVQLISSNCILKIKSFTWILLFFLAGITNTKAQNPECINYSGNSLPFGTNEIFLIYFDNDQNQWVETDNGLWYYHENNWEQFVSINKNDVFFSGIKEIIQGADGMIWACSDGGLASYDGNTWKRYYYKNSDIPINTIHDLIIWRGNLWMCSDGEGLASYDGQTFNHYTRENSLLPSNNLGFFAIDSLDNLWILSDGGAIKYDGFNFTEYNRVKETFPNAFTSGIIVDAKNIVWITTDKGLARYDGTSWLLLNSENSGIPLPGTYLNTIELEGDIIWFHSLLNPLIKYDGTSFHVYNKENSCLLGNTVVDIAIDNHGNKWLSTYYGISVFREGGVITSAEETLNDYKAAKVYPNPTYNEVIFEFDAEPGTGYQIEITDKTGRIIKSDIIQLTSTSQMRYTFKTNNIPTGDYYYKITNGSKILKGKFIVLK